MGDIAESLLDGEFDEWSGEYIGPGVGYPRSLDPEHPSNYKKKKTSPGSNPTAGVNIWLQSRYLPGSGKNTEESTRENRIIRRYAQEVLKLPQNTKMGVICKEISINRWVEFMTWVKETYK